MMTRDSRKTKRHDHENEMVNRQIRGGCVDSVDEVTQHLRFIPLVRCTCLSKILLRCVWLIPDDDIPFCPLVSGLSHANHPSLCQTVSGDSFPLRCEDIWHHVERDIVQSEEDDSVL
jgi:hypothetical protein